MVGLSDRRASASGNTLDPSRRRHALLRLTEFGGALFALSLSPAHALAGSPGVGTGPTAGQNRLVRASFFGLARTGDTLLSCGERGLVARYTPQRSWQIERLSTARNLTAIAAHPSGLAITVGHSGVIFVSQNFGQHWQPVPEKMRRHINPNHDAWLTVAIDADRRIVVGGAFGRMAHSADLGKTWTAVKPLGSDFEWHIYQLSVDVSRSSWLMVGESGTLAESGNGLAWREIPSPYAGSFFGGIITRRGSRIAFGMRGRIYRQMRGSSTWQLIEVPTTMSWMAGREFAEGQIMLVGDQGTIAVSQSDGEQFTVQKFWEGSLADLHESPDGQLWIAGKSGLKLFKRGAEPRQPPAGGAV